jgi:hypothetical protein
MSPPATLALDAGAITIKLAWATSGNKPQFGTWNTLPTGQRASLSRALIGSGLAGHARHACLAVPDSWLDGGVAGAHSLEALRQVVEVELGLADITWVGQLTAVTGLAASRKGPRRSGRYLACDIGANGLRVIACEVTERSVMPLAVADSAGDGWLDIGDAAMAMMPADAGITAEHWFQSMEGQRERAEAVFEAAAADTAFRDARAYRVTGASGTCDLSAGQVMESFAPTADRLRADATSVLAGASPIATVLTGGLTRWFPLAAQVLQAATAMAPTVLGPESAAHGALLIAQGAVQPPPVSMPPVSLAMHQVIDGLLTDVTVPLPWTAPFAELDGGPLSLTGPELIIEVAGRRRMVPLTGVAPGLYRVGVRPTLRGSGLLILRSTSPVAGEAVHIHMLDELESA